MKVSPTLVLGASSPLGTRIANRLSQPIRLTRKVREGWISGDISVPATLLADLPQLNTVYSATHIWLLPLILPTLLAKGARRVIAFSSTSRFTKVNSSEPKERSTVAALERGEQSIIALCEAGGADWTILRPTMIYAEGEDRNVTRLAELISRFGIVPLAGTGDGLRQPVHVDDLADVAVACAGIEAARNRAYNLPGGETLTYREMVGRIFDSLGQKRRIIPVPAALWSVAFTLVRPLLPGATAAMGTRMTDDLVFDSEAAHSELGWSPRGFRPIFRPVVTG